MFPRLLCGISILYGTLCVTPRSYAQVRVGLGPDTADKHVQIPDTHLSLIPPTGFGLTHAFPGLLKTDGSAVIQVYDLPDGDFYTDGQSFTAANFTAKGARVLAFKTLTVAGFPAKYCYMKGDSAKRIMALIFGDSTFSTTLIGLYPDTALSVGQAIRDAYATITYQKAQVVDPFSTAPFSLDTTAASWHFALYNKPLFIYSLDGKLPAQGSPFVTVTPYPRKNGSSLQDLSENLIIKDMQAGLEEPILSNISLDSVNGYEAYEVEIHCRLGGQAGLLYQFLAATAEHTIVVEGVANDEFDKNVQAFRALAHTIHIK
ncbi:hypothetical protein [Dinghuibacter silviterrae]|uniref:Uncharacterized protein n=1 Tax=Dinghuibacter silviterrae TaxID=1539049 RepID=A0A4R8DIJ9_9BACT|nr:hypothetical protein [Dinghuibacter silviterrae]TDW97579.1 hypothetical protein EDB95_5430 [Dinghuibacter silviterrae]